MTTIRNVTEAVSSWHPSREPWASTFDYIDLSAVDNNLKEITAPTRVSPKEAPSRARQIVAVGDVLVSTVRPNLNAVAVVPPALDGATASTGFAVLRPNHRVVSRYLFHWVRSAPFIADMVRKATGASYPAVTDRIVKDSPLVLPTLDEQSRIAGTLDQVDALRAKRRQALHHLDELALSIFFDMFGDPDEAVRAGNFRTFPDVVAEMQGGKNVLAADAAVPTKNRVLKISAVTSFRYRPDESKLLPDDYEPPRNHFVRQGDLLMSRANTTELVGAVALVDSTPDNVVLPDKLWRFVWRDPDSVEPSYVWALLQTPAMRRELSARSSGTGGSMKNISKAKLSTLRMPWPSPDEQREFALRLTAAKRIRSQRERSDLDELLRSLQSRAFSACL